MTEEERRSRCVAAASRFVETMPAEFTGAELAATFTAAMRTLQQMHHNLCRDAVSEIFDTARDATLAAMTEAPRARMN